MAFVTSILPDERVGAKNLGREIANGTLEQAIGAVRRLDGKKFTEVILIGKGRELTIGGGNNGRYIVFIAVNTDEAFYNLLNASESSTSEIDLVAGGQLGSFPKRQVVDQMSAIRAAEEFYRTGEASVELQWEKQ